LTEQRPLDQRCLLNGRQMTSVGGASPIARAEAICKC